MTDFKFTNDQMQQALELSPFQKWLGVKLLAQHADGIDVLVPWRDEIISNPVLKSAHGGVLASIIDFAGFYAVLAVTGQTESTVDLSVDYHRPATPGDLIAKARVVKLGQRYSTARCEIFNADGKLLASGRGAYQMAAEPRP